MMVKTRSDFWNSESVFFYGNPEAIMKYEADRLIAKWKTGDNVKRMTRVLCSYTLLFRTWHLPPSPTKGPDIVPYTITPTSNSDSGTCSPSKSTGNHRSSRLGSEVTPGRLIEANFPSDPKERRTLAESCLDFYDVTLYTIVPIKSAPCVKRVGTAVCNWRAGNVFVTSDALVWQTTELRAIWFCTG